MARTIHGSRFGSGTKSGVDINNKQPAKNLISAAKTINDDESLLYDDDEFIGEQYIFNSNLEITTKTTVKAAPGKRIQIKGYDSPPVKDGTIFTFQRSSRNGVIEDIEFFGNVSERDETKVKLEFLPWKSTDSADYIKEWMVKHSYHIWEYNSSIPNLKTSPGGGNDANGVPVWVKIETIIPLFSLFYQDGINNKSYRIWGFNASSGAFLGPSAGSGGEINGCISGLNGWVSWDGKVHGHGFYIQHAIWNSLRRKLVNCSTFSNMRRGLQVYGGASITKVDVIGLISYHNSSISPIGPQDTNVTIGSTKEDTDITISDSVLYSKDKRNLNLGYQSKTFDLIASNNYVWGGGDSAGYCVNMNRLYTSSLVGHTIIANGDEQMVNIFVESVADFNALTIENNSYYGNFKIKLAFRNLERPEITFTSLQGWKDYSGKDANSTLHPLSELPNYIKIDKHLPGLGRITVCNHVRLDFVPVNVSSLNLSHGYEFEVRDQQNLVNDYVLRFIYDVNNPVIYLPMTLTEVMAPVGRGPIMPSHTDKEFNAFEFMPTGWRNLPHNNGQSAPVFNEPVTHVNAPMLSEITKVGYNISFKIVNNAPNANEIIIFRSANDESNFIQIYVADISETSFQDSNLASATTYFYKAQAKSANSIYSQDSNIISATTEPAPLALLVITRVAIVSQGIEIRDLLANDIIDIDLVGNDFSFEIFTNEYVQSVKIQIGNYTLIENNARWAAFGNLGDYFKSWLEMAAQNSKLADPLSGSPHTATFTGYSAKDATGTASEPKIYNFQVTKAVVNNPPVIASVGNQAIEENEILQLDFIVQDEDPANLEFYYELEANTLIESIEFALNSLIYNEQNELVGANMIATIIPKTGMVGDELIKFYANDGVNAPGFMEFTLFVEDVFVDTAPPVLPSFPNMVMPQNSDLTINFTVTDSDTPIEGIQMIAVSGNQTIIQNSNLKISGSGNDKQLLIQSTDKTGIATVTIFANDGVNEVFSTFTVTVRKGKKKGYAAVVKLMG